MDIRQVSYSIDELPPVAYVFVHHPITGYRYKVMVMRGSDGKWHFDEDEIDQVANHFGCAVNQLELYY